MAANSTENPRGALEARVIFEPEAGGDAVEAVTTPSMWALADEWADTLRLGPAHTEGWVGAKMLDAICLQAAQAEGLMRPGAPSLERIAEMKNLYSYRIVDDGEGEGEPDPNADGPAS